MKVSLTRANELREYYHENKHNREAVFHKVLAKKFNMKQAMVSRILMNTKCVMRLPLKTDTYPARTLPQEVWDYVYKLRANNYNRVVE